MNKIKEHEKLCDELKELYVSKNHDYGDSFGKSYKDYGVIMAAIRLDDKLNRFKTLIKESAMVSDESIVDTLRDLANYSLMTIIEIENENNG